jgi:hypothetical protein
MEKSVFLPQKVVESTVGGQKPPFRHGGDVSFDGVKNGEFSNHLHKRLEWSCFRLYQKMDSIISSSLLTP